MKYIIGLGNPGAQYELTRHNIGFLFLDYLADQLKLRIKPQNRLYDFAYSISGKPEIALVRPLTFMNLSGNVIKYLIDVEKVAKEDILVVYDDFHLPLGKLRFRPSGSDAGHNGIKNITEMISSAEFQRLRLGIGEPNTGIIDYVLGEFTQDECDKLPAIFELASEAVLEWLNEKPFNIVMSDFNGRSTSED